MVSAKEAQRLSKLLVEPGCSLDDKIRRAAITGKNSVSIVIPRYSWPKLEKEIKDAGYNYGYGSAEGNDDLLKVGISWGEPTM